MAKEKKAPKQAKDAKAPKELKPLSDSQIKLLSAMPFLVPILYKKQQPPGMNLALAKNGLKNNLPKVNLLPPIVAIVVKHRRIKFTLTLAGLSLMLISVMTWAIAGLALTQSNKDVALLDSKVASEQNKVNTYLPYKTYLDGIDANILTANSKLGIQLNYAKLFSDIGQQAGGGVAILNMNTKLINTTPNPNAVKGAPVPSLASQCGPVDNPFAAVQVPIVACITITGNIADRAQIAALIQRLSTLTYLQDISITQSGATGAGSQTPFTGSAAITKALVLPATGAIK